MLGVAFWGFFWTFAGVLLDSLTTIKQSYDYTTSKQLPFKNEKKIERQGTEEMQKMLQACSQTLDNARGRSSFFALLLFLPRVSAPSPILTPFPSIFHYWVRFSVMLVSSTHPSTPFKMESTEKEESFKVFH